MDFNNISTDMMEKGVEQIQLFGRSDYFCIEVQKGDKRKMNTDVWTDDEIVKPYTVEELLERAEEGRKQIAMGNYSDIDDVLRELDEELQCEAI